MEHWSEKCFLRLAGHDGCVTSVAFSPDGRHIVSGSGDKTVRVWDAQTGQSVMDPLKGHDNWVTSVAFSPDGRHIVSGSDDKTVRVWDAQTGQSVMDPLKGHDDCVTSVAFSPDGRHIVSGSRDKTVRVWDAQTGQSVMDPLKGHDGWVRSVAFSPDGRHIVSGSGDETVRVWDAQTGQSVMDAVKGHDDWVTSVAFSSDGRHIVSGSGDKTVRVPLLKFFHRDDNWIMLPDNIYLLWVPDQNKSGLFWPQTTTVIGCTPTSLQLKNFVCAVDWSQCFSKLHDPIPEEIEHVGSIVLLNGTSYLLCYFIYQYPTVICHLLVHLLYS